MSVNMKLNIVKEFDFLITICNGQKAKRAEKVYDLISVNRCRVFLNPSPGIYFSTLYTQRKVRQSHSCIDLKMIQILSAVNSGFLSDQLLTQTSKHRQLSLN